MHKLAKKPLIIATRESPLAMAQALAVKFQLQHLYPTLVIELLGITTQADRMLETSLIAMGGKGVFVKELEEALLAQEADIAVHSMKDVPMELPPGLVLPVMMAREDARDAFVANHYASLQDLPEGAILGTSSLRRQTQIAAMRPDLILKSLRGNINTRLNKLDAGEYDALLLAAAGLKRLQLDSRINQYFSPSEILPAAGQGALGIECRVNDEAIIALIKPLNDILTLDTVSAERAMCRQLGGGCKVPVAAYATITNDQLYLRGLVANQDGSVVLQASHTAHRLQAHATGLAVAADLLQQGAATILQTFL